MIKPKSRKHEDRIKALEENASRYVNEFAFRHNTADMSDESTFARSFFNGNGRRLTYKGLINVA